MQPFRSPLLVFRGFAQFESTKLNSIRKVVNGKVRNFSPTKISSFTVMIRQPIFIDGCVNRERREIGREGRKRERENEKKVDKLALAPSQPDRLDVSRSDHWDHFSLRAKYKHQPSIKDCNFIRWASNLSLAEEVRTKDIEIQGCERPDCF